MKFDITVCSSFLKACLQSYLAFGKDNILLNELYRNRMILNKELENEYILYFKKNHPEFLDVFLTFFQTYTIHADNVKYYDTFKSIIDIDDQYYNVLINICLNTEEKILLSDNKINEKNVGSQQNINIILTENLFDKRHDNILNNYKLPIIRKVIQTGQSNEQLSMWLSRFINDEDDFIIVDNYIYENKNAFFGLFFKAC
ncbi:hypothetical protein BTS2_2959 [Bacillus sp. TS-2]|nr:hypothetical protein BTS2_2959 [Bacillus sp. TS-2]